MFGPRARSQIHAKLSQSASIDQSIHSERIPSQEYCYISVHCCGPFVFLYCFLPSVFCKQCYRYLLSFDCVFEIGTRRDFAA